MRLWLPETRELKSAAIEQRLLQHDVDIWRLRSRMGIPPLAGGLAGGSPFWPPLEGSSSSSSSSSSGETLCDCNTSNQYQIDLTGLTGTSCTTNICPDIARVWTLSYVSTCRWEESYNIATPTECPPSANIIDHVLCFMHVDSGGGVDRVRVVFAFLTSGGASGASPAIYRKSDDSFDCEGSTDIPLLTPSNVCTWPSSITVTKVP